MKLAIRHDHAGICRQVRAVMKFDWASIDVSNLPAGFFNDQNSTRMIPDLFLISLSRWQSQVQVSFAPSDRQILTLTVNSKWLTTDLQFGRNQAGPVV